MQQTSLDITIKQPPSAWILIDHDASAQVFTYGLIVPTGAILRVDAMGYVKNTCSLTFIGGEEVQQWIRNNDKRKE